MIKWPGAVDSLLESSWNHKEDQALGAPPPSDSDLATSDSPQRLPKEGPAKGRHTRFQHKMFIPGQAESTPSTSRLDAAVSLLGLLMVCGISSPKG